MSPSSSTPSSAFDILESLLTHTDKHAAKLGHSNELSNVLAKISAINSKGEASFVDDKLFALLYNSQPQISQRLVWLEDERVKEDAKEGVIRLPIGDNEKC
jgi:hypothetical protein